MGLAHGRRELSRDARVLAASHTTHTHAADDYLTISPFEDLHSVTISLFDDFQSATILLSDDLHSVAIS